MIGEGVGRAACACHRLGFFGCGSGDSSGGAGEIVGVLGQVVLDEVEGEVVGFVGQEVLVRALVIVGGGLPPKRCA